MFAWSLVYQAKYVYEHLPERKGKKESKKRFKKSVATVFVC